MTSLINFLVFLAVSTWPAIHGEHLRKCSKREDRFCSTGEKHFHLCTAVVRESWKTRIFGEEAPKIFCECQEGSNVPLVAAYEEKFAPVGNCIPCQDENTVYYGYNLQGFDPLTSKYTIDECRQKCYETSTCNFWTYNQVSSKCYLKSKRGAPTSDTKYVSGVKNCTSQKYFHERDDLKSSLPVLELVSPIGEVATVHGLPATFGPRLTQDFWVLGYPDVAAMNEKFCERGQLSMKPGSEIAVMRRGDCTFLQKVQVAQLAGFKAAIILDDDSDANFHRIIAAANDELKSTFIKIPTIFLRKSEVKKFESLIKDGRKILLRLSGASSVPSSEIKFPELNFDPFKIFDIAPAFHENTDDVVKTNLVEEDRVTDANIFWTTGKSRLSPVATVVISVAAGIAAFIILVVGFVMVRRCHYRRLRRHQSSARCHSNNDNSQLPTISQTISSGETGSLEALARWIGHDSFDEAGSDSAEMAVVLSSVECPICYDAIWPPKKIFQCTKGHILCETCLDNPYFDKRCPSCRESFNSSRPSRNLALENLFSNFLQLAQFVSSRPEVSAGSTADHEETGSTVSAETFSPSAPSLQQLA